MDLIIYGQENNNSSLLTNLFHNISYCCTREEVLEKLSNLKNPTLVLNSAYSSYSRNAVQNCLQILSNNVHNHVVLLAPYQLPCAQLVNKINVQGYSLYELHEYRMNNFKFRGELYFPTISNYIKSDKQIPTLALLPPIFSYNFNNVNSLADFELDNACVNYTIEENKINTPYLLLFLLIFSLLIVFLWLYIQFR